MLMRRLILSLALCAALTPAVARAEALKVLCAGAFRQVLQANLPPFEASGHTFELVSDTVGGLVRRIEAGESFDLVIASPAALTSLGKAGKIAAVVSDLARVGVGVGYKEGTMKPDIDTVAGFKAALLAAKGVAYIDPAAGGTSGIYIAALLYKLGIGDEVRAKSVLVKIGYSAERIVSGEADIAVQQISEILPVKGVAYAGPLPAEIQSFTIYAAAIASRTGHSNAARTLIDLIRSPAGADIIRSKGMEPVL